MNVMEPKTPKIRASKFAEPMSEVATSDHSKYDNSREELMSNTLKYSMAKDSEHGKALWTL
jgi:hypothetical protein